MKEKAVSLSSQLMTIFLRCRHSRLPVIQGPSGKLPTTSYSVIGHVHGIFKEFHVVSQRNCVDPVRLSNLIYPAEAMDDAEYDTGLNSGDSRFVSFQLP